MNLPLRKRGKQQEIETRPAYVEDWLETLPYANFQECVTLLTEAVKASNQIEMKPKQRFELIELYHRSYDYYIETQIRTLSKQRGTNTKQKLNQPEAMKQFAIQLARASKITANECLTSKTLFGQTKPPIHATLMSMIYLSHALIYSFIQYSPVPRKVWQELNSLYEFACGLEQENSTQLPLGEKSKPTTIEHTYKQILLASLSDPLHLPFGSIWEVYEQLNVWAEFAQLQPFAKVKNPAGYFVTNIKEDFQPITYSKFDLAKVNENHLLLDANSLKNIVENYLRILESNGAVDEKFLLSKYSAKTLLIVLSKSWGLPAKRYFPRKAATGKMNISRGLNACYYFHNQEHDLEQSINDFSRSNILVDEDDPELIQSSSYSSEPWDLFDQSTGGYCLCKNEAPKNQVHVGDLTAYISEANNADNNWSLGVVRWMMNKKSSSRIGIQTLSTQAKTITIKALSGNPSLCTFRRAFLTADPKSGGNVTVITDRGLYAPQRKLEMLYQGQTLQIETDKLLETSSTSFEQFTYRLN